MFRIKICLYINYVHRYNNSFNKLLFLITEYLNNQELIFLWKKVKFKNKILNCL